MPSNLELKSRCASPDDARASALRCGARPAGTLRQEDTYFGVSRGRLKLRETAGEEAELIYYERPEETSERWSRYTRQPVAPAEGLKRVLAESLGVIAVVRKERDLYLLPDARIHIDAVEGLGTFLEFEVTGGAGEKAAATMSQLRSVFGAGEETVIRASYADLMRAKRISSES